jgi:hypothetical protein
MLCEVIAFALRMQLKLQISNVSSTIMGNAVQQQMTNKMIVMSELCRLSHQALP